MPINIGIIFALFALFAWGFGDFFIQKTTRKIGSWKALFLIGIVGSIGLFPFIAHDLLFLNKPQFLLLLLLASVVIFTSIFDFEALKQGKIAVVEPIISLELPMTIALGITLAHEAITGIQFILMLVIFIGIILVVTEHHTHLYYHRRIFEKGVILAGIGAIGMALSNILVGVSSQNISPLVTIWFAHSIIAVVSFIYLLFKNELQHLAKDIKKYPGAITGQCVLDNIAWISYAQATTLIPIAITTAISEAYVALAVLLGIFINKEKIRKHQYIGITLSVVGVIILSYFS